MCQEAGVRVEFLPPYSLDFNPIEQSFSTLKIWIKKYFTHAEEFENFGAFLRWAIDISGCDSSGKKALRALWLL